MAKRDEEAPLEGADLGHRSRHMELGLDAHQPAGDGCSETRRHAHDGLVARIQIAVDGLDAGGDGRGGAHGRFRCSRNGADCLACKRGKSQHDVTAALSLTTSHLIGCAGAASRLAPGVVMTVWGEDRPCLRVSFCCCCNSRSVGLAHRILAATCRASAPSTSSSMPCCSRCS